MSAPSVSFRSLENPNVPGRRRRGARAEVEGLSREELEKLAITLEEEMFVAADELRFEYAAKLRDEIGDYPLTVGTSGSKVIVPREEGTGVWNPRACQTKRLSSVAESTSLRTCRSKPTRSS